jgi:hydroxymethylbilane synthase
MHTLPIGAVIGTTSPRRKAQLLAHRPDFSFVEIRGNIDTRIRKLTEGQCDALVLAAAGLDRLGPDQLNMPPDWIRQRFDPEDLCPAPGQGALAIEIRAGDTAVREAIQSLHCESTAWCVNAERAVLNALGGGCSVPIGAHCAGEGKFCRMLASVVALDGEQMVQISRTPECEDTPEMFGRFMAEELQRRGASELLSAASH